MAKKARQSRTIQWAIATLLAAIAGKYGFVIDAVTLESVIQDVALLLATLGVINGRMKADGPIEKT